MTFTPQYARFDAWGNPIEDENVYTDVVVVGHTRKFLRHTYGTSMDPDDPSHPRWRLPGARYPKPSPQDPGFRGNRS